MYMTYKIVQCARFERETKAMLQRDLSRQRSEAEWREADRKRIEMELQQAKRDMESEDLLDRIADNPSGRIFLG
jgi:hypothetical protein